MNCHNNLAIRMQPIWNGEANMYDSTSGKIEIQITITNNSGKGIKIEQVVLKIRKTGLQFLCFKELPIESEEKFIPPAGSFVFNYDLKWFLTEYGEKRKFGFIFKGEKTEINTSVINMDQFNSFIKSLYKHHF